VLPGNDSRGTVPSADAAEPAAAGRAGEGVSAVREPILPPPGAMLRRCIDNLRDPLLILHHRFTTRPAVYPRQRWWWLWVGVVAALTLLSVVVLDPVAGRRWQQWPHVFASFADVFTKLGLGMWYLVPALAWLLVANQTDWRRLPLRRRLVAYNRTALCFFILAAVGLSGLAAIALKLMVGRARPFHFADLGMFSFHPGSLDSLFASFPSGHATTVGAVAGILILLFPRARAVVVPVSIWLASTRIFVGAHYPSDTVVGYALGFGFAVLTALVFARLGFLFQQTDGLPVPRRTFWYAGPRRATAGSAARTPTDISGQGRGRAENSVSRAEGTNELRHFKR
jgi:undecaprenyl-diphosphatase